MGRIITSTSSGVIAPIPNLAISNALAPVAGRMVEDLAAKSGRDGVTTNIVLPGRVLTDRIRFLDEQKAKRENVGRSDHGREHGGDSRSDATAGRRSTRVVAFLASERASLITAR